MMKVLVIEDHPPQLKLASQVLSAAGHDVSQAAAAEQALKKVKSDCPDIILLDLCLPGADGLTLVQSLKDDPETRHIPIVALTSYQEKFPKTKALSAGCDAYLLKPVSTRTLPEVLAALVRISTEVSESSDETPYENSDR